MKAEYEPTLENIVKVLVLFLTMNFIFAFTVLEFVEYFWGRVSIFTIVLSIFMTVIVFKSQEEW